MVTKGHGVNQPYESRRQRPVPRDGDLAGGNAGRFAPSGPAPEVPASRLPRSSGRHQLDEVPGQDRAPGMSTAVGRNGPADRGLFPPSEPAADRPRRRAAGPPPPADPVSSGPRRPVTASEPAGARGSGTVWDRVPPPKPRKGMPRRRADLDAASRPPGAGQVVSSAESGVDVSTDVITRSQPVIAMADAEAPSRPLAPRPSVGPAAVDDTTTKDRVPPAEPGPAPVPPPPIVPASMTRAAIRQAPEPDALSLSELVSDEPRRPKRRVGMWVGGAVVSVVLLCVAGFGFHKVRGMILPTEPGQTRAAPAAPGDRLFREGECAGQVGNGYVPLDCAEPAATLKILKFLEGESSETPDCPGGTDYVRSLRSKGPGSQSGVLCVRSLGDEHPGDVGKGGGRFEPGDCTTTSGVIEETVCVPGAVKVTGLVKAKAECPPNTKSNLELVPKPSRDYNVICIAPA